MHMASFMARMAKNFTALQLEYGTLGGTIIESARSRSLAPASRANLAELLERQAGRYGDKPFILYGHDVYSFRDMNSRANRLAHALLSLGAKRGDGLAIMTENSPAYLQIFFAAQKLGMYAVPCNTALRGAGLAHILNNSEVRFILAHPSLLPHIEKARESAPGLETVIADDIETPPASAGEESPAIPLSGFYDERHSLARPPIGPVSGDLAVIMYTSGTTGLPKGVVYRHGDSTFTLIQALARTMGSPADVMYTCLPLYHANALFVTTVSALAAGASVGLDKRFSASRFWDRVRFYRATTFNLLGAMIPILMKQPERPGDKDHRVKRIVTSACPAELWARFEERFGVEIWEGYGAVDGGGAMLMNIGNAPKGSIGKPLGVKVRIVDEDWNDVPAGERGELVTMARKGRTDSDGTVEYFKNGEATGKKVKDGWIRTGDFVYQDRKGYFYFVGRDSESMRRRGENVSTYEVEVEILKHPAVQEAAVYGVPSELGEEDIMASLVLVDGKNATAEELVRFLGDKLAYFAVPRYWRFANELPKTGTHRVIKNELRELGVTADAFDAEKAGVMPARK